MKKIITSFFTLQLMFSLQSHASDCLEGAFNEDMSFSDIQEKLGEQKLDSLECLLQSLPEKVKSLRTYIKSSLSLQEASPMNPRAIVASPTGSYFMSFNGHQDQKGFDEIEIIALDKTEDPTKWIAGSLKLENGQLKLKQDNRCFSCHGNPIKPIWNKYPSWPNAYGSIDDWMPAESDPGRNGYQFSEDQQNSRITDSKIRAAVTESNLFRRFRQQAITHPRYSILEAVTDPSNPVFPYTESYRDRNTAFRPNLILGTMMANRHSEVMKNRVKESPFFNSHKATYLYYQNCNLSDDRTHYNKVQSFVEDTYRNNFGTPLSSYEFVYWSGATLDASNDAINHLVNIGEHEHNLQFISSNAILDDSSLVGYFSGLTSVEQYLEFLLADYVLQKPELSQIIRQGDYFNPYYQPDYEYDSESSYRFSGFNSAFLGEDFHNALESYRFTGLDASNHQYSTDQSRENFTLLCRSLHIDSEIEMNTEFRMHQKFSQIQTSAQPRALQSCIECHDSNLAIGPRIPFSNPSLLSSAARVELVYMTERLTNEDTRPAHLNGNRMPLGRATLSEAEVQQIVDWINQ